jgi:hypothetical protein
MEKLTTLSISGLHNATLSLWKEKKEAKHFKSIAAYALACGAQCGAQ